MTTATVLFNGRTWHWQPRTDHRFAGWYDQNGLRATAGIAVTLDTAAEAAEARADQARRDAADRAAAAITDTEPRLGECGECGHLHWQPRTRTPTARCATAT